ncbi:MAG: hypothetical protein IJJ00_06380 [Erysipelotrichaceae bacterium]|nr:hypothetical protein [Erysipelotrichaceae bacterium]
MNKKETGSLAANILLIVLGIVGTVFAFKIYDANLFRYYTVDSNLLCLVSSICFVLFMIIKRSQQEIPYWVMILRLMATVCLAITFIVVVAYLAPIRIWKPEGTYLENLKILLFQDDMLYQHLLCPVVSFLSFIFLEGDRRLNKKKTIWWGMAPTLVYGVVMLILNVLYIENGPYPFFRLNEAPFEYGMVMGMIILICYIITRFALVLNQKSTPRRIKKK